MSGKREIFSKLVESIPPSGIREFFDMVVGAEDVISLGVGEPDFVTPWTIREDAIYSLERGYTSYSSNKGLLACREAIVSYLAERFQLDYDEHDETLVTVGVSEGADLVFRSLLNPGDEVILPQPAYVCYAPLIEMTGATVVPMNTMETDFLPDPDQLKSLITPKTKAIVLCSPSNPTGRVIPRSVLESLAEVVRAADLWVISDEIYAELSYDESYTSMAALPGMKPYTILLSGFSKAFSMTGWRLGYLCAPKEVVEQALKIHQYSIMCAPITAQYGGIEALKSAKKDVVSMRKAYQFRRNVIVKGLNELGLPTHVPEGAFYCFPSIKSTGLTSTEFAKQLLKEERVAVVPGHVFGLGGEGYVRCCYAVDLDDIKEALQRIKRFVNRLKEAK